MNSVATVLKRMQGSLKLLIRGHKINAIFRNAEDFLWLFLIIVINVIGITYMIFER